MNYAFTEFHVDCDEKQYVYKNRQTKTYFSFKTPHILFYIK